jgi:hypothetical protein
MILFAILFSFALSANAKVQSVDLGSVEKMTKGSKAKESDSSDAQEVPELEDIEEPVEEEVSSKYAETKTPFYKKLGSITIRAKEDYVFIRAGKSAIIMDASGKIIIDSAKDLVIRSKESIVFKAKKDIILSPRGDIIAPKLTKKLEKEEADNKGKSALNKKKKTKKKK